MTSAPARLRFTVWLLAGVFVLGSGISATQELGCLHHAGAHGAAHSGVPVDQGAHAHDAGEHAEPDTDGSDERCTCIGSCVGGSSAPRPTRGALTPPLPSVLSAGGLAPHEVLARSPTRYLLPPANGPPHTL